MKLKLKLLLPTLTTCFLSLALTACGSNGNKTPDPQIEPTTPFDYQALIENVVLGELPGVVLYIDSPQLHFYSAAGIADQEENTPMQIDARIPNGSAGKKLTALLAGMLAQEQRLDLDKPITEYLASDITDHIPNASIMTTRQMLQHTAGLFDYLNDSGGAFYDAVIADPDSIKTDEFALQFALDKPAHFSPSQGWRYSNTGYILSGLILDKVLGAHHSGAMRSMIIEPLGLASLSYGGIEQNLGSITSGYFKNEDGVLNTRPFYQNIGVADAPVVGNAKDMADLLKIIVEGALLSEPTHQFLMADDHFIPTGINGLQYSAGLFKEMINGKHVIHHGGSELGYATYNFYVVESKTTVAMLVNCNGYKACDDAHDALYQKVVNELTK
ncbi:beta-lactamase family protein [Pseudoalteromonas xiamenensis]|uniref:serine hydrolase domain-containing protein n=1 Tax=Pseudoalteromonas xiamenensis TaxID=882626 RepID=UPI0027E3E49A|nr:serine hydrolase domain-containing protein [Pseudoalteromonas xiamenensis]WMN60845.1 beta-lactamase family protein [Pseudoalteromonas xiamenensis]